MAVERQPNCYIEFRVHDAQRYQVFMRFFKALQSWTQQRSTSSVSVAADSEDATYQSRQYEKVEDWLLTFRPADLELLGMPDHREAILALKDWHNLTRSERRQKIDGKRPLQTLADFADMLSLFKDIDYTLVSCDQPAPDYARMEVHPDGEEIRHRASLEEMLLFFGFFSIIRQTC